MSHAQHQRSAARGGGARDSASLTYGRLIRLFLPLSLSDMIMVLSVPLINAVLGRLPDTEVQTAAYGVAMDLGILLESPIIMILHAATASAGNPRAYRTLGTLTWIWNGVLTALYLLIAFTPIYDWVAGVVLGLPPDVAAAAWPAFAIMPLWPAAIGYRRYLQGQLIHHGRSREILMAGLFRLVSLAVALVIAALARLPGAVVAGVGLQVSVVGEAAAVAWFAHRLRRQLAADPSQAQPTGHTQVPERLGALFWWYLPLAGTQLMVWIARPLLRGGIARAALPLVSLAAWQVAWPTASLLANGTRMVQQMTISLVKDARSYQILQRFSLGVGVAFSLLLALVAATPLADLYLASLLDQPASVVAAVHPVLWISAVYPLQVALQNWMQGLLVQSGRTGLVNVGAFASAITGLLLVYAGALLTEWPGAPIGAGAYLMGMLAELVLLWQFSRPARRRFTGPGRAAGSA